MSGVVDAVISLAGNGTLRLQNRPQAGRELTVLRTARHIYRSVTAFIATLGQHRRSRTAISQSATGGDFDDQTSF
jgi:hypothetical protein